MSTDIVIRLLGDASGLQKELGSAQTGFEKFSKRVQLAGVAVAGAGLAIGKMAMDAAADQSANFSKFAQITKRTITDQDKVTARSLNLSRSSYADYFSQLSAMYQSNGIGVGKANKMAAEALKTSADAAAFGNTTVAEAVEAQLGLLKGSGELLEKYSVSIKASDISARLKAKGLDKLTGSELKAAEATVRHNLVQEKAKIFLGQAERESGSLESRNQKLAATFEDLKVKLGDKLLPIIETGLGKLQSLATWVENNETKTKIFATTIGVLGGVILAGAAALRIMALATALNSGAWTLLATVMWANPVFIIGGIILAIGAALVIAYKKSETFRTVVNAAFEGVKTFVINALQILSGTVLGFWSMLINGAAKAFGWVPGIGDKLKGAAREFDTFKNKVASDLAALEGPHLIEVDVDAAAAERKLDRLQLKLSTLSRKTDGAQIASGQPGGSGGITARALGGPVSAGRVHLVGERGPELFVPNRNGTIVPNDQLAVGGGPEVLALTLDLGRGIQEVVTVNLRDHDRNLKRTTMAGGRRTV